MDNIIWINVDFGYVKNYNSKAWTIFYVLTWILVRDVKNYNFKNIDICYGCVIICIMLFMSIILNEQFRKKIDYAIRPNLIL